MELAFVKFEKKAWVLTSVLTFLLLKVIEGYQRVFSESFEYDDFS